MTRDYNMKIMHYDAWNHQVDQTGGVSYRYDGLGRRVRENGKTIYYNDKWQAVEERITGTTAVTEQYTWSPVYIDAMIRRYRDTNSDGIVDQTVHVTYDANFNVTAIITAVSQVPTIVERFLYDTYGGRGVMNASWTYILDTYAFRHGFAGGKQDLLTGRIHFRNRDLDPVLGRWISRDPIGYDGSQFNLFEYVSSNPLSRVDPTGELQTAVTTTVIRVAGRVPSPAAACIETAVTSFTFGYAVSSVVSPCLTEIICSWYIDSLNNDPPAPPPPPTGRCLPCNPASGTIGWERTDFTGAAHFNKIPPRGYVSTPHMHVKQVNQTPYPECKCKWNKLNDVIAGTNNAGMPNANSPVTGGGPAP